MSDYAWVVYRTWVDDMETCWTVGPHGVDPALEQRLKNGEGEVFRLYDDDDILYYEGRIVGDYDGFEPLYDFGMPYAGCTNIAYKKEGGFFDLL